MTRLLILVSFLRGLFITIHDKGHIATILDSWPEENVKVCGMSSGKLQGDGWKMGY